MKGKETRIAQYTEKEVRLIRLRHGWQWNGGTSEKSLQCTRNALEKAIWEENQGSRH